MGAKNSKGAPATFLSEIVQYWTAIYLGLADPQLGNERNNVALLGESYQGLDGDVWLKVRVETFEGPYVGWVNQQYVGS